MKSASIILSILLLILSCLPCADAAKEVIFDANGAVVTHSDDHSKEAHTDLCSPFCICNCCGAQVLSFTPISVFLLMDVPTEYVAKQEISYKSQLASMFHGCIWQPPQIA